MVAAGLTPTDPVRWWLATRRVRAAREADRDGAGAGDGIEVVDGEEGAALGGGR